MSLPNDLTDHTVRGQVCLACFSVILVFGKVGRTGGSVAFTQCPAVDEKYYICDGKMVEMEQTTLRDLLGSLHLCTGCECS